jgi:hypothetical protein
MSVNWLRYCGQFFLNILFGRSLLESATKIFSASTIAFPFPARGLQRMAIFFFIEACIVVSLAFKKRGRERKNNKCISGLPLACSF